MYDPARDEWSEMAPKDASADQVNENEFDSEATDIEKSPHKRNGRSPLSRSSSVELKDVPQPAKRPSPPPGGVDLVKKPKKPSTAPLRRIPKPPAPKSVDKHKPSPPEPRYERPPPPPPPPKAEDRPAAPGGENSGAEAVDHRRKRRFSPENEGSQYANNSKALNVPDSLPSRPRAFAKDINDVRDHYNERPENGKDYRKSSPIANLRFFNNFIKSVLIQLFSRRARVVLDLGCGKGGDLVKWSRQGVEGYIGVDIADVSVKQAKERYFSNRRKTFWADFCVGDAFGEPLTKIVHPDAFPVDIVSCQFTMHYAFESKERVEFMLQNVSSVLSPGGRFIGTVPNDELIRQRIEELPAGERRYGNSVYSVQFDDDPKKFDFSASEPYGYKYHFFLDDAVGNVPEYIIVFDNFVRLAKTFGLRLIYHMPFLEMFDEETRKNPRLLNLAETMKVKKADGSYGVEGDEREACGFYMAFAFEKE